MTARDKYAKELSSNPRFVEAPHTGQATMIVGARPMSLFQQLKMPENWVDVTEEESGTTYALIGAEAVRAKGPNKG
jgi:hypothetical protein